MYYHAVLKKKKNRTICMYSPHTEAMRCNTHVQGENRTESEC